MLFQYRSHRILSRAMGLCHALALAWLLASLLSLPIGATEHALGHVQAALAASQGDPSHQQSPDKQLGHCGSCDLWNALYSVLLPSVPALHGDGAGLVCFLSPARSIDTALVRWFMQRAPPLFV